MLKSGDTVPVTIDKPAAGGRMLARVNGQVVLVAGAIPGERVIARVDRVSKGVVFADTVDVDAPSPDRRQPFGDPLCGGCVYSHIAYFRQLEIKTQIIGDAFKRIGRLELPAPVGVAGSPEDGYRMRARLHVRGARLGFFRESTHDVCDARMTRQLLPATCDALDRLSAAMQSAGLEAIREIDLSENVDASDRVVYLDAAAAIDADALERLAAIDGFTGVASAFGACGNVYVTDRLTLGSGTSIALRRHVLAFFQGNRHLLSALVAHVVDQAGADGEVVDLYAGVGIFAVSLAASGGGRVTAVEGDRHAAADLTANAASAGGSIVAVHQSVEHFVESISCQPDVRPGSIIVDPPRTGLSREALDGALRLNAPRLIYVSCDVATLARDARRIVDAGYAIDRADAFDLFPNTPHVETVVVFTRTWRT
jgi:23S rRNA (uracil1939-C5)-methyltransferase